MLKWLFRVFLFRTLFRRFWLLGIAYAVARRFMAREQPAGGRVERQREYR